MKDALLSYGAIDSAGGADDYDAEDHLDHGTIASAFRLSDHRGGVAQDFRVVFLCTEALNASTAVAYFADSADDVTFAEIATSGAAVTTPAVGDRIVIQLPAKYREYTKVGIRTAGSTTSGEWTVSIERGAYLG